MHVLFLLSRIEKSGVALHTLDLAEGLIRQGHTITMITGGITETGNSYLNQLNQRFAELGVEIKQFKTPTGNIFRKGIMAFSTIWQVVMWIRTLDYDVIHAQSPYMTFLPWLARKKFVSTVHNVQLRQNLKYKKPDHLIAISTASKTYAIQALGARPEQVSIVCHGVSPRFTVMADTETKSRLRRRFQVPQDALVIGFTGRITREKGLDHLLDAIAGHLRPEQQDRIQLLFVGDYFSPQDEQWLEQAMATSPLRDRIKRFPFQDPKPLYDIFDIFVLPSLSEAFGLVCVEAMMSGTCVVRTDTNGASDQIDHGRTGFIYPVGDTRRLGEILSELIDNNEMRLSVAKMGRDYACKEFTLKAMTRKTVEVYHKLI